jgi:hypothetical protein
MSKKYYNFDKLPVGTFIQFKDGVEGVVTPAQPRKFQRHGKSLYLISWGSIKNGYDVWIDWARGYIDNVGSVGYEIVNIRKPFKRR